MPALATPRALGGLAVVIGALGLGALAWPNVITTTSPILAGTQLQRDVPKGAHVSLDGRALTVQEEHDPAAPDVVLRRYVVVTAPRSSRGQALDLAMRVPAAQPDDTPREAGTPDAAAPSPAPSPAVSSPDAPSPRATESPAAGDMRAGEVRHEFFRVVPRSAAFGAFGLAILILLGLPYALVADDSAGARTHGVFYSLLVENNKLSLGRLQFLLWFTPAFGIYAALSVPLAAFAPVTTTLALLLGLSGITAGLAASAPAATRAAAPDAPVPAARMSQSVENDQGQAEVSRYQYLVLSLLGAILLTVSFLRTLAVPDIPTEFLYLVGASQGTFVFSKIAQRG